jgi:uncharacterized SAM-binding protein YcdF (DUF218 family)
MSMSLIAIIKAIILPPTLNFITIAIGLLLFNKYKILSRIFIYSGALSLVLFCFTPFSDFLLKGLEKYPALIPPVIVEKEQAIVVLSGGSYKNTNEYAKDVDGAITLQRNHYASFLHKQTGLPILVTGGALKFLDNTEASVMTNTLQNSFNVSVRWQEDKARNTAENAIYSAELLEENQIDTIYLVTHAWHMPRSVMMFEGEGINVTPAPTIFTSYDNNSDVSDYIPSALALYKTRIALHEYIGILWYKIRY